MSVVVYEQDLPTRTSPKGKKSIVQELRGFPFLTPEIIQEAEGIYHRMINDGVHRVRIRKMMLYICVKRAYMSLKITIDPNDLAKKFDLSDRDKKRCDSIFSPLNTGCLDETEEFTPIYFIKLFFDNLSISQDLLPFIEEIIKVVQRKNPFLMEEKARTLAAGFLKYFIEINNLEVNEEEFYKVVDRSPATVGNIKKRISETYSNL